MSFGLETYSPDGTPWMTITSHLSRVVHELDVAEGSSGSVILSLPSAMCSPVSIAIDVGSITKCQPHLVSLNLVTGELAWSAPASTHFVYGPSRIMVICYG